MSSFLEHIQTRSFGLLGYDQDEGIAWVDYEEEIVTFPLWNLSGQLVGYQQYNWDKPKARQNKPREQKYFTYTPKQTIGVYGIDMLPSNPRETVYLVEGVWEALVGWSFGLPCIAVLGVTSKPNKDLHNFISSLPYNVVSLCQPDKAGVGLSKLANRSLTLAADLDDCLLSKGWLGVPEELVYDIKYGGSY